MDKHEILDEWIKDSRIDETRLVEMIRQIPLIHGKYLRYLSNENDKLRQIIRQKKKLYQILISYYRGELNNTDTLKELGWPAYQTILAKNSMSAIQPFIEADKHYQEIETKVEEQSEKISILASILKEIGSRNYHIRAIIDLRKIEGNII